MSKSAEWQIDESWLSEWNPLRDEYGYPINTAMPAGLYVDHEGIVAKRWNPNTGSWSEFIDLTRTSPWVLREQIRRQPPELPFEALDHETKKGVRRARLSGKIRPSYQSLPLEADPTGERRRQREEQQYKRMRRLRPVGVLVVSAILVFIVWAMNRPETANKYDAQTACENAIESVLKAPSTAQFSNPRFTESEPNYVVQLDVDAQNSFGATIRETYTCQLAWTGSRYRLDSLR